jgi:sterol desaturase/sphingolipid hydroxylase (fatty acid hydroxylase superfamily)
LLSFLEQHQLPALLINLIRLCLWLLVLAVIFLPLERLFGLHPQKIRRTAIAVDIGYYFLSGLLPGLLLAVPLLLVAWAAHRMVPHAVHATVLGWPLWLRALIGLVVSEIGFYWGHRWTHEIPWLWRFHAIHHSPERLDFMVNTRAHPVDLVFVRLCGLIPLYILGLAGPLTASGSLIPVLIVLVATVWGFFIHANMRWRLGLLEHVIATPAFHHWHHTRPEPRDRNYASMLPWMDRIFATHHLPRGEWPAGYGIDAVLPETLAGQLLYPFRPEPQTEQADAAEPEPVKSP